MEPTHRQEDDLAILYSVTKCLPGSDVSCSSGIQVQYSTFDVQITSELQFSVNGRILEEPWRRPFRSEKLYVSRESWLFAVVQVPGVRVLYDYHGRVYIRLDPSYQGRVRPFLVYDMDVSTCMALALRPNFNLFSYLI